ncbi:MAG: bifunctional riboflavin kinase/FAD synthetase [Stigonema ocellatum SAG 48.90 = DSM 106950]|nr:bifunctional riboflavin kinase/FAD synthetase [Stigonema ocellatum SAG 48.90 = DSM 106950]
MLNVSQNGCSVWVTSSTELALTPTVVALGKFDGVHRGHQQVIQPILKAGEAGGVISSPASPAPRALSLSSEYTYSTVVTFNPHPQEFFTGQPRTLLTPLDEKIQQLRSLAVEQLVLLPFDKELSALTPEQFVEKILVQQLQCQRISVGQDFRFGNKRSGTARDLQLIAAKHHIPVTIAPLQTCTDDLSTDNTGERISTTLIRQHLEKGEIQQANHLLGRPYTLVGSVIKGQQLGRTIGFPTANLQLPKQKFLPRFGVYAVRVKSLGEVPDATSFDCWGVMNIGNRPTVNGIHPTVEVHLLDWSGDLYCKKLTVQLEKFLRPEQKFSSLEALKTQIQQDCAVARAFFSAEC